MVNPPVQPTRQYPTWLAPSSGRLVAKGLALAALVLSVAACPQSSPPSGPDGAGSPSTDPNAPAGGKTATGVTPGAPTNPAGTPTAATPPATPPATPSAGNTPDPTPAGGGGAGDGGGRRAYPEFVSKMIEGFRTAPPDNPPRKIIRYSYKGQTVYYVSAPCCDFQSDLYDSQGTKICSPDGGITGRGDGKCPDFASARKDELAVWQDTRAPGTKGPAKGGTAGMGGKPAPLPTVTHSPPIMPPKATQ